MESGFRLDARYSPSHATMDDAMKFLSAALSLPTILFVMALGCLAEDQPNILWITAEDMSPTLGCYGDGYATTPNIDRLAQQSTRYLHAFATSPVCSPSRSCLITGCYATSLGTHQMRSAFPIPEFIRGFPSLLCEAGYYTTNNYKTDYNTSSADRIIAESWAESSPTAHWRNRPQPDKPFFSVFNIMTSHQSRSMVWTQDRFRREVQSKLSRAQIHDPDKAPIPSYYPDTLVTRRIVARYYDCVTAMDAQVGTILAQLKQDGLDDNTIVFFYSDHGSGMPRHKRLLHDSGMHVPLLVRFPEKWAHLAPTKPGESTDRLVSFVDFPPTVLTAAGIESPGYMQGMPFLGKGSRSQRRKYVFGHRDRIDEVIDLSRSVRDERYLYIRNFMPHRSWNQYSGYSDLSEIRHELYYLAERGTNTPAQSHYVGSRKPMFEFYDCVADPANENNLYGQPSHLAKIEELHDALMDHINESNDLGFLAESEAWKLFKDSTPWETAREPVFLEHAVRAINASPFAAGSEHVEAVKLPGASNRYWQIVRNVGRGDGKHRENLKDMLADSSAAVRIEAAYSLAALGDVETALPVLISELQGDDLTSVLHATRSIELLGRVAQSAESAVRKVADRAAKLTAADTPAVFVQSRDKDLAMFCGFSANGFLNRLREGPWTNLLESGQRKAWANTSDSVEFLDDETVTLLSKGKNLWIVHRREFTDFELTAEVRMPDGNYNAGIGFRCQLMPNGKPKGYQCEVAEEESGMLYAIASGGWVWPKGDTERETFFSKVGEAFRSGRWNHFRIRCEGSHLQIWVNGILTTDIQDETHQAGRIALQHHGKGGAHHYRKVRIRELAASP